MEINLFGGAYKGVSLDANAQECINLYLETDETGGRTSFVRRPGLKPEVLLFDEDGLLTSGELSGSGSYTLDGVFAPITGGTSPPTAMYVCIHCLGNESARTFAISGFTTDGFDTENVTGANADYAISTKRFYAVTGVTCNGANADVVRIGFTHFDPPDWLRGTEIRGTHVLDNILYVVYGNMCVSITTAYVVTQLNSTPLNTYSGPVTMDDNGTQVMICDGGGVGYVYDTTDSTWNRLADDDSFFGGGSVTYQDGYFISHRPDYREMYVSTTGDGLTWSTLDLFTAESDSSKIVRVISDRKELWAFKQKSVEVFYNTGTDDLFLRKELGALDVGCQAANSVVVMDNSVIWLADDLTVRRAVGYSPQVISQPSFSTQIGEYDTTSDAVGMTYRMGGRIFYMLNFPTAGVTWTYDAKSGNWVKFASYIDNAQEDGQFRCNVGVKWQDKQYMGDYRNGMIYTFDTEIHTDNLQRIIWTRRFPSLFSERLNLFHHWLELEFEGGVGTADQSVTYSDVTDLFTEYLEGGDGRDVDGSGVFDLDDVIALYEQFIDSRTVACPHPVVKLRWSNDGGHSWSSFVTCEVGAMGEYTKRVRFNRLGAARHRTYEVSSSSATKFVMIGAFSNISRGVN